ncbi:MAG TPA: hypothetical protein VG497_01380 [Kribbella sp.]|nr:hypothetical protein [Kribbella sp.]
MEAGSLISLVLSSAALAVSAWALIYTRQQALVERSRRYEELMPRYKAALEPGRDKPHPDLSSLWILELTLLSYRPLTSLRLSLSNTEFRIFQTSDLAPGELQPLDDMTAEWNGPLGPGDAVWSMLELEHASDEDLPTLVLEASDGRDSWTTVVHPDRRRPPRRRGN